MFWYFLVRLGWALVFVGVLTLIVGRLTELKPLSFVAGMVVLTVSVLATVAADFLIEKIDPR